MRATQGTKPYPDCCLCAQVPAAARVHNSLLLPTCTAHVHTYLLAQTLEGYFQQQLACTQSCNNVKQLVRVESFSNPPQPCKLRAVKRQRLVHTPLIPKVEGLVASTEPLAESPSPKSLKLDVKQPSKKKGHQQHRMQNKNTTGHTNSPTCIRASTKMRVTWRNSVSSTSISLRAPQYSSSISARACVSKCAKAVRSSICRFAVSFSKKCLDEISFPPFRGHWIQRSLARNYTETLFCYHKPCTSR